MECQLTADVDNHTQEQLREDLMAHRVHEQHLPCGKYKTAKAPNGFWQGTRDNAGCPPTASQQDPHPERGKPKKSAKEKRGSDGILHQKERRRGLGGAASAPRRFASPVQRRRR